MNDILEMEPEDFFTEQRLAEAGNKSRGIHTRITNASRNHELHTVRKMTQRGRKALLEIKNFGRKSINGVAKVLAMHGIELPD